MSTDDKIRCYKNVAQAAIDPDNKSYPIALRATTIDGKVVEVLLAPTDSDRLGRHLIELAAMSLKFWTPTR